MKRTRIHRSLEEALQKPGEVEALTLYKPRIVPEKIGALKNLKRLSIIYSEIEKLPAAIGTLTKLETLVLYKNKLSELPDLSGLIHLTGLDLSGNCFKTVPQWIAGLPALERLDLRGNRHLKVLPEIFFDFIIEILIEIEKFPPALINNLQPPCRGIPDGLHKGGFSDKEYDYLAISGSNTDIYMV